MITKERLIELICSYAAGATDDVADGVLYNSLASAILLELQLNGAKPNVMRPLLDEIQRCRSAAVQKNEAWGNVLRLCDGRQSKN